MSSTSQRNFSRVEQALNDVSPTKQSFYEKALFNPRVAKLCTSHTLIIAHICVAR